MQTWLVIRHLHSLGYSARHIAQELHLDARTVRHALAQETAPGGAQRPSPVRQSLEPLRQDILDGLGHRLDGERLLETARGKGYQGSRATFYTWLGALREEIADPSLGFSLRFETEPGQQCQFDWSPYVVMLGGVQTPLVVYSLVLGFSRRVHFHPSFSEKADAVLEGLEAGLRHFGGVCQSVLIDNAKAMVLMHRRSRLAFNDAFLAFCAHYRLHPIAATPSHPQTKGKVENPFQSLEARFLTGGQWEDLEHLLAEMGAWESEWERRIHQTTKEAPAERFAEQEKGKLQPLPERIFLGARSFVRQLNNDATFSYGGVRYCVPAERARPGGQVRVRTERGRHLAVYNEAGHLLIRHALQPAGSPPVFAPECYEALRRRHLACLDALLERFRQRYVQPFEGDAAGSRAAEAFLGSLLAEHPHRPERTLGHVLELLEGAPDDLAVLTLAEAVELGLCSVQALQALLARRLRSPEGGARPSQVPLDSAQSGAPLPLDSSTSIPLAPRLDIQHIQRPLDGYGRALSRSLPPTLPPTQQTQEETL